jgi:hypothetical protein
MNNTHCARVADSTMRQGRPGWHQRQRTGQRILSRASSGAIRSHTNASVHQRTELHRRRKSGLSASNSRAAMASTATSGT